MFARWQHSYILPLLARKRHWCRAGYTLGFAVYFSFFKDFLEINYLSIYWTDFHDFFLPNGSYFFVDD